MSSVDTSLAQLSNVAVYSAMAVYAGALCSFTVDLSGRGRAAAPQQVAAPARELVGAGGPAGADGPPAAAEPPAPAQQEAPRERRKAAGIAVSLTVLAFGLHLAGVVARGLSVHRPPWGNMYEFSVAGSLVVTGVFLAVLTRRDLRFLGTFVVGPVLLTLGLAVTVLYAQAAQLVPALHSYWLAIHVSVAFIASALFTLGFSTTILQLVQDRQERAVPAEAATGRLGRLRQQALAVLPVQGRFMKNLPSSVELERTAYRLHSIAFPLWGFTLVAGAIWAQSAWGRYWNWDPKEVWTFIIWVAYAGYLHARATRGWDGRRAAYLALGAYACILFNYLVVNVYFVGLHSYAQVSSR